MAVAASSIINRVRNQLIDTGTYAAQRWTDAELLYWLSDGQRTIVATAPRTSQKLAVVQLAAGTRQALPADGYMYLTAYRNMGPAGTTPGNIILQTPRTLMDTQYPTWHYDAAAAAPRLAIFDQSDPTTYFVYPPADGTGHIELSYAAAAAELVNLTDTLVVKDIYATPLFDYVMWRATQKDSDYASGIATNTQYMQAFETFIASLLKDPFTAMTQAGKA